MTVSKVAAWHHKALEKIYKKTVPGKSKVRVTRRGNHQFIILSLAVTVNRNLAFITLNGVLGKMHFNKKKKDV